MKKCLLAVLALCILLTATGCSILFPFSSLLSSDESTAPEETVTEATVETTIQTTVATIPEETEPRIPAYILHTLEDKLLFYKVELVKMPEDGEGTWEFRGDWGYSLSVVIENGTITSVIMDNEYLLYENGNVIMTIDDYLEDEYKKKCQEISYEDLARNPDKHKGEYFTFTGEVIQVYEDGMYTILRIDVTPYTVGDSVLYKDTIYAEVYLDRDDDRILEDDIITVWGSCSGLITYESIFGQQISIPGLDIKYYEIVS